MTGSASLYWFARHELRIAWRDWLQMMSGGYTRRDGLVALAALIFVLALHLLAYAFLRTVMTNELTDSRLMIVVSGLIAAAFMMILSQAIEYITRVFYARADLDLILSSPASARNLFSVRIVSVALVTFAMTAFMTAPLINSAAVLNGAQWLLAYIVVAASAAFATAVGVVVSVALFEFLGPKKARLISQIVAAVVGASLLIGMQVVAIIAYGNYSRWSVLTSDAVANMAPYAGHIIWAPAQAASGNVGLAVALFAFCAAALAIATALFANRFASCAIAAAGAEDAKRQNAASRRGFRTFESVQALRVKEWRLLARDPWLTSQTLMQVLYLIPPAVLLWRDMGANNGVEVAGSCHGFGSACRRAGLACIIG